MPCAVHAAARRGNDHPLAAGQSFGAAGSITKCLAGNDDAVDPAFKLAGDREVVHGRPDDDDVGGEELVEGGVALRHVVVKRGGRAVGRCRPGRQMNTGQVLKRRGGEITVNDPQARRSFDLCRDDFRRQGSARRVGTRMLESM